VRFRPASVQVVAFELSGGRKRFGRSVPEAVALAQKAVAELAHRAREEGRRARTQPVLQEDAAAVRQDETPIFDFHAAARY